jgi:hypothetical protein
LGNSSQARSTRVWGTRALGSWRYAGSISRCFVASATLMPDCAAVSTQTRIALMHAVAEAMCGDHGTIDRTRCEYLFVFGSSARRASAAFQGAVCAGGAGGGGPSSPAAAGGGVTAAGGGTAFGSERMIQSAWFLPGTISGSTTTCRAHAAVIIDDTTMKNPLRNV